MKGFMVGLLDTPLSRLSQSLCITFAAALLAGGAAVEVTAQGGAERSVVRVEHSILQISWLSENAVLATVHRPGVNEIAIVNTSTGEIRVLANGQCPSALSLIHI